MHLMIYLVFWAALGVSVLALAIYRNVLGLHDPVGHISPESGVTEVTKNRLLTRERKVEIWGQSLTILLVVYGLVLVAVYLNHVMAQGGLGNH